jgi:TonB family protein
MQLPLLILFIFLSTACSNSSRVSSAEDYLNEGYALFENEQYVTALKKFREAEMHIENDAHSFKYKALLGQIASLANMGSSGKDEARALIQSSVGAYHNRDDVLYYNLGILELRSNRNKAAISALSKAIEMNSENPDYYWNRGTAYDHLGEWQKAINDYDEGLRLDPVHVEIYNNRGKTYLDMQYYEQAVLDLEKALELNPDHRNAKGLLEKAQNSLKICTDKVISSPDTNQEEDSCEHETVKSVENASHDKVAYQNALQGHVKSCWRWSVESTSRLRALVRVRINPDGEISEVRIIHGSGDSNFDDSVVQAVTKAFPIPAPPPEFYTDFATIGFWFDSKERVNK